MSFKASLVTLALLFFSNTNAQIGLPCHANIFDFTPRHSLNISSFMGEWYIHEVAGSHIGQFPPPDYKCKTSTLSLGEDGDVLNLNGVDRFINTTDGTMTQINSAISVNNTRSPMSSMWRTTEESGQTAQVIILYADSEFSQWAVVYSCAHHPPLAYRYEILMAMTRSRNIVPDVRNFLKSLMVGNGFRIGDHHPVDQSDC